MRADFVDPEDARRDRLKVIGEILPGVLGDLRRRIQRPEIELGAWWKQEVGESVASRTRVVGWKGGRLTIAVASPSHLQEYQLLYRGRRIGRRFASPPPVPVDEIQLRLDDRMGRSEDDDEHR